MKIKKKVKKTIKEEVTLDILCNMCGLTLSNSKRKGNKDFIEYSGLKEVEVHGGYDSFYIGDMTSIRFSICEKCLCEKILPKFKIEEEVRGDISDYITKTKYNKKLEKFTESTRRDFVKELKALDPSLKKADLEKMTTTDMNKLYFKLSRNSKED